MKRLLGFGFLGIMAAMSMGCAGQAKCWRTVNDLEATSLRQDQEIRDLNAEVAVVSTQQAGTTISALASEGWTAAAAAFGWAQAESPLAYHQASEAYGAAAAKLQRARQCYLDNGGNREGLSFEDYRLIATKCLSN